MTTILYVTPEFPKPRHGFQAAEIAALVRAGVDVSVVSLRTPTPAAMAWLVGSFGDISPSRIRVVRARRVIKGALFSALHPRSTVVVASKLLRAARSSPLGVAKTALSVALGTAVAQLALEEGVGWIHADFASAPATAAMTAAEIAGLPWSFTGHAFDVFSTKPAGRATRPLLKLKVLSAAKVFAANSTAAASLARLGREPTLKRNGVPIPSAPLDQPSAQPPVVLGLGALVPKKGFDVLIEAVRRVAAVRALKLVIAGDGEERGRLVDAAAAAGIEVEFTGSYSYASLPQLLSRASVVVLPSRRLANGDSDGTPTVLIEALAHGRAVIGCDIGGVSDLVRDGETGLLVAPEDPAALAEAIERLLANPRLAHDLAARGHRLVEEEYCVERTSAVLIETIPHLLSDDGSDLAPERRAAFGPTTPGRSNR
jgi:glycosyltransferase involved in cell wall biosynthesis